MNITVDHSVEAELGKFESKSLSIWIKQGLRKLLGKPLLQDEVLVKVVNQLKVDGNLLGILLFGSVASETHTWKSDIDLIFVYEIHVPPWGLSNRFVDGIVVQYFFTTLDTLIQNTDSVPYLLHMFSEAKILFDRHGSVAPVIFQLQKYFDAHPDVSADWARFKDWHQKEKIGPVCRQTTIIQRWDELEEKYSGGTRKRTFFIS